MKKWYNIRALALLLALAMLVALCACSSDPAPASRIPPPPLKGRRTLRRKRGPVLMGWTRTTG